MLGNNDHLKVIIIASPKVNLSLLLSELVACTFEGDRQAALASPFPFVPLLVPLFPLRVDAIFSRQRQ